MKVVKMWKSLKLQWQNDDRQFLTKKTLWRFQIMWAKKEIDGGNEWIGNSEIYTKD